MTDFSNTVPLTPNGTIPSPFSTSGFSSSDPILAITVDNTQSPLTVTAYQGNSVNGAIIATIQPFTAKTIPTGGGLAQATFGFSGSLAAMIGTGQVYIHAADQFLTALTTQVAAPTNTRKPFIVSWNNVAVGAHGGANGAPANGTPSGATPSSNGGKLYITDYKVQGLDFHRSLWTLEIWDGNVTFAVLWNHRGDVQFSTPNPVGIGIGNMTPIPFIQVNFSEYTASGTGGVPNINGFLAGYIQ